MRPVRSLLNAMMRGFAGRCPHCGEGKLFSSFIKPVDRCASCGEDLHHHRSDDLPAYLVVVIVGHIVVGAFMAVEATSTWSMWQHFFVWIPLTIGSALALLRPIKGAVIGLQWAGYMHGFGGEEELVKDI
nr:DUF983 domain-containing protein [Mesorhizobium sp. NBSH29]